ncbi:hypothetical protein PSP6_50153 [Paraburkholderia tropica]|nr:hypothetical protein PSP6_50153 [Paraburkholderia tropica]
MVRGKCSTLVILGAGCALHHDMNGIGLMTQWHDQAMGVIDATGDSRCPSTNAFSTAWA